MQFGAECQDLGGEILFNKNVDDSWRCISIWIYLQLDCGLVVYSMYPWKKRTWAKRFRGASLILKHVDCLHVTSLPARGLPGCKEHCFQCATPRSWTKWAHEPKAALRPKGNPRTGLQVLQNGTKHLCCRTDSGKIREAISLSLQSSSISTGNTPVQHAVDACVVCMRLHGGPGLDRLSGFLLTSYERNATEKLMERAVSWIQRACTSHKGFQKDDGHAKTRLRSSSCSRCVALVYFTKKPIEGHQTNRRTEQTYPTLHENPTWQAQCFQCHVRLLTTRSWTHLHSNETFVDATWHVQASRWQTALHWVVIMHRFF